MYLIASHSPAFMSTGAHCLDVLMAYSSLCRRRNSQHGLTGGIDSRLLAVLLSYFGVPFEVAASGVRGTTDLVIAEKVAKVLDRHFHITYHHIDDFESTVPEIFGLGDGLFDVVRYHRAFQLQRDRISRGVSLVMSGTGGELFKDFWWLQDFPSTAGNRKSLFAEAIFFTDCSSRAETFISLQPLQWPEPYLSPATSGEAVSARGPRQYADI